MLSKNKNRIFGGLGSLLVLSTALFSFTSPVGGDVFQIYLNNKMVLQEYVHDSKGVKNLNLDNASVNDQITVHYSHCGTIGKSRHIALKNDDGKVLKQWNFQDADGKMAGMSISVKELVNVQKANGGNSVDLYYSAKEMPRGKQLASINMGALAKAKP